MTGRHPNRFGCFQWGHSLRPQEVTIAEALQAGRLSHRAFRQVAPRLGRQPAARSIPARAASTTGSRRRTSSTSIPSCRARARPCRRKGESSMVTVDAALEFIRDCAQEEEAVPGRRLVRLAARAAPGARRGPQLYADQPAAMQHFYGEITAMDRAFGKLRAELKTLGIRREHDPLVLQRQRRLARGRLDRRAARQSRPPSTKAACSCPALLEWPARIRTPRPPRCAATPPTSIPRCWRLSA